MVTIDSSTELTMTGPSKRPPSPSCQLVASAEKKRRTEDTDVCPKCNEHYQGKLDYHKRNGCKVKTAKCVYASGEISLQPKDGVYKCAHCPKAFKKASSIQDHARECKSTTQDDAHEDGDDLESCVETDRDFIEESRRDDQQDIEEGFVALVEASSPACDSEPRAIDGGDPPYRTIVKPDFNCTIPDFLRRTTFIVNTQFWVLICIECEYAVAPTSASSHLRRHHPQCSPPSDLENQLQEWFPDLKAEAIHPGKDIRPVFGLKVHPEYLVCNACLHGYRNQDSFRKHQCPPGSGNPPSSPSDWFESPVQTFFAEHRSYFPVITSEIADSHPKSHYDIFKKQHAVEVALLEASTPPPSVPEDHRQLLSFLRKEGWISHVQDFLPQSLSELVQEPGSEGPFQQLGHHVHQLMDVLQRSISASGYLLQRLIGKRPSNLRTGATHVLHVSVEAPTLKRYSKTIVRLIMFILRCHIGWKSTYKMALTDQQSEECSKLIEHLKSASTNVGDKAVDDIGEEPNMDEEDEEDYTELGSTNEETEGFEIPSVALSSLAELSETGKHLLNILCSLFTHLPTPNEDKFFSPLTRFLIIEGYQKNGEWLPPRKLTEAIAVLTFVGRQTLFYQLFTAMNGQMESRYSAALRLISPYLNEDLEAPLSTLYLLKRPLDRLTFSEDGSSLFTALDFSGQNVIVNGKVLHISDIRFFVESVIGELQNSLLHDLFFDIPDLVNIGNWSPGIVNEEPRNVRAGYSCFTDPHNSFLDDSDFLLKTVLEHPRLSGRFHYLDGEDKVVWKAAPCLEYLERCERFEMLLFAAAQTTVGEPPRGTEAASQCFRNISGGNVRNVFILFQHFCLLGTFNKSVTYQGPKIMRVPLPELGRLWSLYLVSVRPLVVHWQAYFHGRSAAFRAGNNLFFGLHRPVTSSQLSQAMGYHTLRLLQIRITISLWRHIATWFLNHHAVKFQEHLASANRATLAAQMGHGELTHGLYASDARLPSGIDFHTFFRSMKTSGIWHELLGFPPVLSNAMNSANVQSRPESVSTGTQVIATTTAPTEQILDQLKSSLLPDLLRIVNQARASDLAVVMSSMGIQAPESEICPTKTITVSPSRLFELRRFMGDTNARFKTQQQAEFVEALASGEPSLLVIGPTGSGKTLPIMLNVSQNDRGKTTMFILPLQAMHDEYHERARRYGLSCDTWDGRASVFHPPQIILVSVEHCTWDRFKCYAETLCELRSLTRIVVDEAHLLSKHGGFRLCMNYLWFLGHLPVPIILMTATCPPALEQEMFSKVGRPLYRVLRNSTHRPEIQQQMVPLANIDDDDSFQLIVAGEIRKLASSLRKEERMLLFCLSHGECDELADLLGWKPYHSHVTIEDRATSMSMWKSGQVVGLACTSMLNCCLDYPYVRYVFHLNLPRDAIDYSQAIGRCSRDGQHGTAITYHQPRDQPQPIGADKFGRFVITEMANTPDMCMNLILGSFLDGQGETCFSKPDSAFCEPCNRMSQGLSLTKSNSRPSPNLRAPSVAQPTLTMGNEDSFGQKIRSICDTLAQCCVYCWLHGEECTGHTLESCPRSSMVAFNTWAEDLVLPKACCFFCGGPIKLTFRDPAGQLLNVHEHASDTSCRWKNVFKPLAFYLHQDRLLVQGLQERIPELNLDEEAWSNWLCRKESLVGVLNMVKLLKIVCQHLPLPFLDDD